MERMSPEVAAAMSNLRDGQKLYQLGMDRLSTIAEERGLETPVPSGIAMEMIGGLAGRTSYENFLVMRMLLDIIQTLDLRIRAIEQSSLGKPRS